MKFEYSLPYELVDYIYQLANNKCSICQVKCNVPYKKLSKFYYCSEKCYFHF